MLASIGVKVVPTKDVPELRVSDYDVLVLPGGAKALEYMRQDEVPLALTTSISGYG